MTVARTVEGTVEVTVEVTVKVTVEVTDEVTVDVTIEVTRNEDGSDLVHLFLHGTKMKISYDIYMYCTK